MPTARDATFELLRNCGTPWNSKGYRGGHHYMARKSAAAVARWSDGGRLPVVIDASSCAYGLASEAELDGISVLDSTFALAVEKLRRGATATD